MYLLWLHLLAANRMSLVSSSIFMSSFTYILITFTFRYPKETMQLITELAQNIVGEYREKRKIKLQRKVVKASDAASSKVKGISKSCEFYHVMSMK